MKSSIKGKVAIVTGAGKGIGSSIARVLAEEKAKLMLASRTKSDLESIKRDILLHISSDSIVEIYPGDIGNSNTVKELVSATIDHFGRIDILINNAGVAPPFVLLQELSIEDLDETINTNLKGPLYAMRYTIPYMVHQGEGGFIININSVAGKVAFPYSAVYCASKFGLTALTESISQEQRQNHIKVIGIYPGEVATPIWDRIEPHIKQDSNRMLNPEDVAEAVRYVLLQPEKTLVKDVTLVPIPLESSPALNRK